MTLYISETKSNFSTTDLRKRFLIIHVIYSSAALYKAYMAVIIVHRSAHYIYNRSVQYILQRQLIISQH